VAIRATRVLLGLKNVVEKEAENTPHSEKGGVYVRETGVLVGGREKGVVEGTIPVCKRATVQA